VRGMDGASVLVSNPFRLKGVRLLNVGVSISIRFPSWRLVFVPDGLTKYRSCRLND